MSREAMIRWGIVVAVIVLLLLVAVVVIVLRAARSKVPMVPAASGLGADPDKLAMQNIMEGMGAPVALHASFIAAMRRFKELSPRAADRLRAPWVMAIGEVDAGTSSMINSLTMDRLGGAVGENSSPCVWHFFDRGVVLDIDGSLVLDPATGQGSDRAWKTLISQLQRYRPERPLDAIVLAIPAVDLVGPTRLTRAAASERAARIEARLTELQKGIGLRLPVYAVITKCDRIPGFSAFARSLPPSRSTGMLGWSSPYSIDAAFNESWVDEALDATLRGIQHAEFDALARRESIASGGDFLLLPPRITAAAPALREFLQRVFRPTAWEQGASLRGIYFTGDAVRSEPVDGEPLAVPVMVDPEMPLPPPELNPVRPFIGELFSQKIFAEQGIARPGPRVFPSKNRAVAIMQVATIAFLVLGPVALWWGGNGLKVVGWQLTNGVRRDAAVVETLLKTVESTIRTMEAPGTASVSVFPLLGAMADVNSSHLASPFLPTSWLSPLPSQVQRAVQTSFQLVVLPELKEGLNEKIRTVIGTGDGAKANKATAAQQLSLPQYVAELDLLGKNIGRFNKMSSKGSGETRDLAELVHYVYGEEVAPSFFEDDAYYRRALEQANSTPIQPDARTQSRAIARAGELTAQAYASLITRVSDGVPAGGSAEDELSDVDASKADVEAIVGLRTFLDPDGPVQKSLASIQLPFVFGDKFAGSVSDSLNSYTERLTGEMTARFADRAHSMAATRRAFDALLHQRFMEAPTGHAIAGHVSTGMELRWDDTRLNEAIALDSNYETFVRHGLDSLPDALRGTVRRLATVQLAAAMGEAVATAQLTKPSVASAHMESQRDLRARVTNFELNAPRLSRLLDLFDGISATELVDSLDEVTTRQATGILSRLDSAFDLSHRYVLPASAVAQWSGRAPFSGAAFGGGKGAFAEYLATEQDAMRSMVTLARPIVNFIELRVEAGAPAPRSLHNWLDIIDAVDRLDRKPPAGPLAAIDRVIVEEIDSVDVRTCLGHAPRPGQANDVLSKRVDDLRTVVWRRCADVALGSTRAAYARLSEIFRTRIAGRFPFGPPEAAADAQPADIIDLMHAWDAVAPASADLAAGAGAASKNLMTAFGEMAQARKFFASLVDSAASGRAPMFDYAIEFRTNRAREINANQIAEWSAQIGPRHLEIGMAAAARRGRWSAGDTVNVLLRWATGSQFTPVAATGAGAVARDGAVEIGEGGTWSLLRLLRAFESDAADPEGGSSVAISVRTLRRAVAGDAGSTAKALLRVKLYDPDTKAELVLPRFPQTLPSLGPEGSR